jgi:hypothetical protein
MLNLIAIYFVSAAVFSLFLELIAVWLCDDVKTFDDTTKIIMRTVVVCASFPFAIPIVLIDAFIHVVRRRMYYYQRQSAIKASRANFEKNQWRKG